jgi:hypothetical protein
MAAGFGPAEADRLIEGGRFGPRYRGPDSTAGRIEPDLERAVTAWLTNQRSSFRRADVLVALAACTPRGLSARQAGDWVEQFCHASLPAQLASHAFGRWTTAPALAADRRLVAQVAQVAQVVHKHPASPPGRALVAEEGAFVTESATTAATVGPVPVLGDSTAVSRLLSGIESVQILLAPPGRTNLLAHADVLAACAEAWAAAGRDVAVVTSTPQVELRWGALTGIAPYRAATGASVIIVDHADRRTTADLLAILAGINRTETAILVEGGAAPRLTWMRSDGFAWLGDRLGRVDPGPPPAWTADAGEGKQHLLSARREPALCRGAAQAAGLLLRRWVDELDGPVRPTLVGLGYAETDGLNQAARHLLAGRGALAGPELRCRGKVFQAGDEVIALRRLSGELPQGTRLEVLEVKVRESALTVRRPGFTTTLDLRASSHLGYSYAVTPALAVRAAGPLLVLGPLSALGPCQGRVLGAAMAAPIRAAGLERIRPPLFREQGASASARQRDRGAGLEIS